MMMMISFQPQSKGTDLPVDLLGGGVRRNSWSFPRFLRHDHLGKPRVGRSVESDTSSECFQK